MNRRLNYFAAAPEVVKAMMALDDSAKTMTIPLALRELVKMRCSQINGCAGVRGPAHHSSDAEDW